MSAIENRVVNMQFNNDDFQRRVATTLASLERLNKGLQMQGAAKGLQDLGAASKNVSLSHVESGVQSIADRFKAMSVIGVTALATITHKAIEAGTRIAKAFTIDPLTTGFREYETNLNSIQTVLANTSKAGTTLADVNKALAILNEYSDQTIYNFAEMAKNIGTFTAAGVSLDVATQSIKGIANLAALSGSNSEQASRAMYQLSQAISAGKVSLEDWNSVVQAGMGGKVFQDALMQTARVHGVAIDDMVKKHGSFRLTLQDGWLSSKILTDTLMQFTGDLTDAQLASMGYSQQQIAEIQKLAQIARGAATEVKTFTQLMSTLKEGLGSGWAQTWQIIFGDFEEAKKLWTSVNNVLGDFVKGSSDARNKVLGDWKELGGRTVLIEAISNAFKGLMGVLGPIKHAWLNAFPPATGEQLYKITVAIRDFTKNLIPSGETMNKIARIADGLFAILDIGWMVLKEGIKFFFGLFGVVTEGTGGILEFAASFFDFFTVLRNAIENGKGIQQFFKVLRALIEPPIRMLKSFAALLFGLFDGFDGGKIANKIVQVTEKFLGLDSAASGIEKAWQGVSNFLTNVFQKFYGVAQKVMEFFDGFGQGVGSSLTGLNLNEIFAGLGTGAIAALILALRGMAMNASDIIESLTDALGSMQNTLRAATLLQIALAVGVLAVSVKLLSNLNAEQLATSLTAITVMFTQLLASMLIFEKLSGFAGFAKMPFIAASMILLGAAINVLAVAVERLADLDWESLARGLTGVAALLAAVLAAAKLMPASSVGLIATATALVILGSAVRILVTAVAQLAAMSWEELARGLTSVGAILAALTLFSRFVQANALGVLSGAGILLLALSLNFISDAVKSMAEMSWGEIGKGLTVLAGALTAIGLALTFIPPTAPLVAAGIYIVAIALESMAKGIQAMSQMSWGEIGKGLTVLAGGLTAIGVALTFIPPTAILSAAGLERAAGALKTIGNAIKSYGEMNWGEIGRGMVVLYGALTAIVLALTLMKGALLGAAALITVAAALAILAPVLVVFSKMSWGEIAAGLGMLAGVFIVLGVAGALLGPVAVTLLAIGVAVNLFGIGVLAAGAGMFVFATALTALAVAGAAGTTALVAMVGALAGLIPEVLKQIGIGIAAFAGVIAKTVPAMTLAVVAILTALLNAIDQLAPKIIESCYKLLTALFETILKYMPRMVDAGLKIIIAFLQGVSNNIGRVVDTATTLGINFIQALQRNIPRLIQAGVDYVINFLNAIANAIRSNSARMGEAGANIGTAIIEGMIRGLGSAVGRLVGKAVDAARSALNAAKSALGIKSPSREFMEVGRYSAEGMAIGLEKYSKVVEYSAASMGEGALDAMKKPMLQIADIVAQDIDSSPKIRPVVDLTDVKDKAGQIGTLLKPNTFEAAFSAGAARKIVYVPKTDDEDGEDATPRGGFNYTQNNYSPKALSSADIYRQTNNQLSRTKGALP